MYTRPDTVAHPLYVITAVFNPYRYQTRWALYEKFKRHVEHSGGVLYTAEIAYGERAFVVTDPSNPHDLQLRTNDPLWHKERALNLLVRKLPADWRYMAWVDADVQFVRTDWVKETVHQLQHHAIVQMFAEAHDLTYAYGVLCRHQSFVASLKHGAPKGTTVKGRYEDVQLPSGIHAWHPGFAWAITRRTYDEIGGFLDTAILGAADNHMAKALVGDAANSVHPAVSQGYRDVIMAWQTRAKSSNRNIGYVDGLLLHNWHGKKINRRYWDRWQILTKTQFDPHADLEVSDNGLYRLRASAWELRDRLLEYFSQRNEDANS